MPWYNPPPNWPPPPAGWAPPPGWLADPSWGPPPAGWQLWLPDEPVRDGVAKRRRFLPQWRPVTWILILTNLLFVYPMVHTPSYLRERERKCNIDGSYDICGIDVFVVGAGRVVFLAGAFLILNLILVVIWAATRKGRPSHICPWCRVPVKRKQVLCLSCGYDLRGHAFPGSEPPSI